MSVQLPTSTGKQSIQVAAVIRDYASEHGRIVLADTAYQAFWPGEKVRTLALFAADAKQQDLRRQVSEVIAGTDMFMTRATDIRNESMAVFDRTFRITEVLRVVSLSVAFIGVLSALMALQLERGKEYAVLRALGLTRGQIAGLISGESLLMGMLAACVAIPTGVLMAWVLIESVQKRAFGWTMPFHVDGVLLLQTLLVGVLAAGLAAIYPAWRSANRDPAPQLRED
jgi:putative ABC transport system permease protein